MWTGGVALAALGVLVGMALLDWMGRRVGLHHLARGPGALPAGTGQVQAAVAGLVGLLLAFTVSGAAARLDTRRRLIVDETNAIGTAWLRLELLPDGRRARAQQLFRDYLDSRLATYRHLPDFGAVARELAHSQALQRSIWAEAIGAVREAPTYTPIPILVLPSLNAMFDIAATRTMVSRMHPPGAVYGMLVLALLASALYAGYSSAAGRTRSWIHVVGYIVLSGVVFTVILDLEYPRAGLLRETAFDQALIELRASMR